MLNTQSRFAKAATLVAIAGTLLVLSPAARAVTPAPDGGYPGHNTAEGDGALFSLSSGVNNTAVGFDAMYHTTSGSYNKADGAFALFNNTAGSFNVAEGFKASFSSTTAYGNTAVGYAALVSNTGAFNIALGYRAGARLGAGNHNIYIGNEGDSTDLRTIRIGTEARQVATYIAGIDGVSVSGTAVCVASDGQLGECSPSSERFKHDIGAMDKASEVIFSLRPVTFRYNADLDPSEKPQFGLVAEEVEKIAPDLVRRDKNCRLNGVRYDAVNAMLLNEFLKEHRKVEEQASRIAEQEKAIKTLIASVKEQADQIQKVSAELTLLKARPRLVDNHK